MITGGAGDGGMPFMAEGRGIGTVLRDADAMPWLRPDLARAAAWALLAGLALLPLAWVVLSVDGIRHTGVPLAADFTAFWTAAREALRGNAAAAYDPAVLHPAQLAAFGGRDFGYLAFSYPPPFLLALLPFGLLSREGAAFLFLLTSGAAYVLAVRTLLPRGAPVAALLAFPAVLVVLDYGQNGLLSAALLGGGVVLMDRRPVLAGICFGLLTYKPQLGPLIPVALAVAGRWRSFGTAAATALVMAVAATVAFGLSIWPAFLDGAALAREHLEGMPDYSRQAGVFAAARLAGLSPVASHLVQLLLGTLPALLAVVAVARLRPEGRVLGAVLVAAIPFAVPYFYEYDAVMLAIPMAWLLSEGARDGFRPGEKTVLLLTFLSPLMSGIPNLLGNLLALGCGAALLALVTRRALETRP